MVASIPFNPHVRDTACNVPAGATGTHLCDPAALRPCCCVRVLRVPMDPASERASGYRNVYATHSESHPWRAKVKLGGRLVEIGRAPLPHQAAAHVANWYRKEFGPNWAQEVGRRKSRKAWRVMRDPGAPVPTWVCWRAVADERGRWTLSVWEWGREVTVREVKRGGAWVVPSRPRADRAAAGRKPPGRVKVFGSREDAAAHVLKWMVARWGLFVFLAARRA